MTNKKKKTSVVTWLVLLIILFIVYAANKGSDSSKTSSSSGKTQISNTAKVNFKKWALKNTAVTSLEYADNSDWKIWVRLSPEKYTTKKNVENIALRLAEFYKIQTKYDGLVIVTVWDSQGSVVAKGKL